jgi:ketosteroid isomerase-like protein
VHPEAEWETGLPGTPTYRGPEGVRRLFRDVETAWEDWEIEAKIEAQRGETMVVEWRMRGRGRTTGVNVEGRQFAAVEFSDGLARRVCAFQTSAEALEAVGLRE